MLDDPDFRGRPASPRRSSTSDPQLLHGPHARPTAAPSCSPTSPTSPSTSRTAPRPARVDPVEQAAARSTCDAPPRRRRPRSCCCALGPEEFAARAARAGARSPSPTPRSATPTSRCSPPGCAPATCSPSPAHVARADPAAAVAGGLGRRDVRRGAALPRRGPVGAAGRAARRPCPNICLQMLLRGRNTVGYTPYPTEVTDAFVARGRRHRHRHLPDLRRAQRRRADAARRSTPCARPAPRSPRSRSATPATCPTRTRRSTPSTTTCGWPSGSSRPARTSSRSRTWPGCCAPPAARTPGHGAARAVRPAGAPAHPRHRRAASSPPCSPRSTPASTPSTRPAPRWPGTTSQPSLSALVAATDHTDARHRARPARRSATSSPTGRPSAGSTRRSSPGLPVAHRPGLPHEIPGGQLSNLRQQAIALGLGEKFEQIEDMYAAANRHPRQHRQGHAVLQGGRRPRAAPGRASAPTRPSSRRTPASSTSPTRSSASSPASSATRPAAGPSRSAPRRSQGRTVEAGRRPSSTPSSARACATRPPRRRSTGCCSPARPGTSRSPARRTATCRCCRPRDYLYGLRRGRGARGRPRARASG